MAVNEDDIERVAGLLRDELYERAFRGKARGRFAITRAQMKQALGVQKLHTSTVERIQDAALARGLSVIDLDDVFSCVDVNVLRKYRRPPRAVFDAVFEPAHAGGRSRDGEDEDGE